MKLEGRIVLKLLTATIAVLCGCRVASQSTVLAADTIDPSAPSYTCDLIFTDKGVVGEPKTLKVDLSASNYTSPFTPFGPFENWTLAVSMNRAFQPGSGRPGSTDGPVKIPRLKDDQVLISLSHNLQFMGVSTIVEKNADTASVMYLLPRQSPTEKASSLEVNCSKF